jgi:lipopolysaccharide/colanic/teichoic acid biosynthesis glycosyltransferase
MNHGVNPEPTDALGDRGIPRWVDAFVAGAGLVVLFPLFAGISLCLLIASDGPVFFQQQRVGRRGRPFKMLKFRTMRCQPNGPGITAADDARVTRIGARLRKSKLDELPELWNVFVGDMALVGPRPEVPQYVDMANPLWKAVLAWRPGISDPVTLLLRNEEGLLTTVSGDRERFYREVLLPCKLRGSVAYAQVRNVRSDLRVLANSLLTVLFPRMAPPPDADSLRRQASVVESSTSGRSKRSI